MFTLTADPEFVFGGDKTKEQRVVIVKLPTPRAEATVRSAGGEVFATWGEAVELAKAANGQADGKLKGTFSDKTVNDLPVYLPVRKAVA